jgi:hypothetical protein
MVIFNRRTAATDAKAVLNPQLTHQPSNSRTSESVRLSAKSSPSSVRLPSQRKPEADLKKTEIEKTHRLIRTPRRRPIQIRSQINIQILVLAHIPSSNILPLHPRRTPRKRIPLKRKSPKRVLRTRETHWQNRRSGARGLAHAGVQFAAFGVD